MIFRPQLLELMRLHPEPEVICKHRVVILEHSCSFNMRLIREVKEEIGLDVSGFETDFVGVSHCYDCVNHVYFFKGNFKKNLSADFNVCSRVRRRCDPRRDDGDCSENPPVPAMFRRRMLPQLRAHYPPLRQ